jgi:tRNA (cytidine/uridine-2'-O-)-methyltransferase
MLHIVLFCPEIPQNTGNIGRLCAFTGSRLHLIHPLGFKITDSQLKRAGMDYWKELDVVEHDNWDAFEASPDRPTGTLWLMTTHATKGLWEANFSDGDGLVFGNEGHGAPDWLHQKIGDAHRLRIPSFESTAVKLRSLNLSTSVGIAAYEALRQIRGPVAP